MATMTFIAPGVETVSDIDYTISMIGALLIDGYTFISANGADGLTFGKMTSSGFSSYNFKD